MMLLSIDGQPNVEPPTTWANWFVEKGEEIKGRGEKILDRYYGELEPEIFRSIHMLTEDGYFVTGMIQIQNRLNYDRLKGIPRPRFLGAYYGTPQQDSLDAIIKLYNWCQKSYDELNKAGFKVYKVPFGYFGK